MKTVYYIITKLFSFHKIKKFYISNILLGFLVFGRWILLYHLVEWCNFVILLMVKFNFI